MGNAKFLMSMVLIGLLAPGAFAFFTEEELVNQRPPYEAPGADYKALLASGKPHVVESSVAQERDESRAAWIDMFVDVDMVVEAPLWKIRRILLDYRSYPKYFRRYKLASGEEKPEGQIQHITFGISLLGFSFDTRYTLLVESPIDKGDEYRMVFTQYGDDTGIRQIYGSWYVIPLTLEGRNCCYVRYINFSSTIRRFPLQRGIMAMFVDKEYTDVLSSLAKAARK